VLYPYLEKVVKLIFGNDGYIVIDSYMSLMAEVIIGEKWGAVVVILLSCAYKHIMKYIKMLKYEKNCVYFRTFYVRIEVFMIILCGPC
jgi:hypothetical protein